MGLCTSELFDYSPCPRSKAPCFRGGHAATPSKSDLFPPTIPWSTITLAGKLHSFLRRDLKLMQCPAKCSPGRPCSMKTHSRLNPRSRVGQVPQYLTQ